MSFKYWHDEIADMPTKDEHGWYDAETGCRYKDYAETIKQETLKPPMPEFAKYRAHAKSKGFKSCKGSPRQVAWAEKIRAEKIDFMAPHVLDKLKLSSAGTSAKFWIDNRNKTAVEIATQFLMLCDLVAAANSGVSGAKAKASFVASNLGLVI